MRNADVATEQIARPQTGHPLLEIAVLVALSIVVTLAAIAASGLTFAHAGSFFELFAGLVVALVLLNTYQYVRMPENTRTILCINMIIIYVVMCVCMMVFQYPLATFRAYPVSHIVELADQSMGFHWLQFSVTVHEVPYLSEILGFCYSNWMREFVVVFMVMSFRGKFDDLYEFTAAYIIAGMVTLSVSGLLDGESYDAVASYALNGIHHPVGVSREAIDKVAHLRAGLDRVMDFDRILGLVCFPSFHAGAAVLLATATRNLKYFWLPFLGFNVLMLIGTITEGGHNFTDVIGGCLIAVGGIAVAQTLRRSGLLSRVAEAVNRAAPWSVAAGAETTRSA
jgi:membrane-associated phospholipid phosphatase